MIHPAESYQSASWIKLLTELLGDKQTIKEGKNYSDSFIQKFPFFTVISVLYYQPWENAGSGFLFSETVVLKWQAQNFTSQVFSVSFTPFLSAALH